MALPQYRTLGEMRVRLARAVGYSANPDAANQPRLVEHLQTAQRDLYERLTGWARVVGDFPIDLVAGTWRYEWPSGLDPDRVEYVYARIDGDDWIALSEGFGVAQYDLREAFTQYPTRFRRRDMLEIFPTPDQAYRIVVGAQDTLAPFESDSDRCTVPDDMVLNLAIAFASEQPGGPQYVARLRSVETRLAQLRARAHGAGVYLPGAPGATARPRPRIAGDG